jgi:alkane 1-monooxygenase
MKEVLPFYQIFLVPLGVVLGYIVGNVVTLLSPFFVFVIIPLMDLLVGIDTTNPSSTEEEAWKEAGAFRVPTIICAFLQPAMVLWGAYAVTRGTLTTLELVGFTIAMGFSSGIMGINVSHELQHRVNQRLEPFLSLIMLLSVLYMHWAVEHVAGHHRNVATPKDPATGRLGESFYTFFPRTVFMGMKSSWDIEAARLKRKSQQVVSLHNRVLLYYVAEIALVAAVWAIFGKTAVIYLIGQSIVAISLLEIVNYVEHYGLLRKEISPGQYEPVTFQHSWNSSNWLTNRYLFNLQRHSDHHYKPDRRYPILRHFDQSPQLPTGYAGMLLLAYVPPLWRRVMDPRVRAFRGIT